MLFSTGRTQNRRVDTKTPMQDTQNRRCTMILKSKDWSNDTVRSHQYPRPQHQQMISFGVCGSQRLFVKFHTSVEQSESVFSALHPSSVSARWTSATQKPTSPALLPASLTGIFLCAVSCRLWRTSRTVCPLPVPMAC